MPDEAYEVPLGKAVVRQPGHDVTIVAWAPATVDVKRALPEIAKAGISVEFIDPRTLKPLDIDTLVASVRKTKRCWSSSTATTPAASARTSSPKSCRRCLGAGSKKIAFPDVPGPGAAGMMAWLRPDAPKILDAVDPDDARVTRLVQGRRRRVTPAPLLPHGFSGFTPPWPPTTPAMYRRCSARGAAGPRLRRPSAPRSGATSSWSWSKTFRPSVCQECVEQFYDEDVSDALRLLMERGFPTAEAKKELQVPVFSLEGRIRVRSELPEDTYLD